MEFAWIKQYFTDHLSVTPSVLTGSGDDAAWLKPAPGETLLFASDSLICGTHFLQETCARAVAHKLWAANISDIRIKGGAPKWITINLQLPGGSAENQQWLKEFSEHLLPILKRQNISLVGGDFCQGPLAAHMSVIGTLKKDHRMIHRSGAQIGDDIVLVTDASNNPLWTKLGLHLHLKTPLMAPTQIEHTTDLQAFDLEKLLNSAEKKRALNAWLYPNSSILADDFDLDRLQAAHSSIDISDGLTQDLGHICKQSGCAAELDLTALENIAQDKPDNLPLNAGLYTLLTAGESYTGLITGRNWNLQPISEHTIGKITRSADKNTIHLTKAGNSISWHAKCFEHFNHAK